MIPTSTLATLATMLETRAGASTTANANSAGYWRRIALAAETLAGASGSGEGENAYMRRTAVALELKTGGGPASYTDGPNGYLSRIAVAGDALAGISTGGQSIFARLLAFAVAPIGPTILGTYDFTGASLGTATLTRGSTGTVLNSSTILATAAINAARFEYDQVGALRGLLIEPARTNAFLQSETFDNASWTKVNATVTANQGVAPDGQTTADKLFENATAAAHYTQQAFNATSGVTYTFTVFAKAAERSVLGIACNPLNSGNPTSFNLATGTVGTTQASHTADIRNMGNGWYRCRVTATATTTASYSFRVFVMSADNTFSYAGSTSNGLLIWGAQMEVAATATSYIPTTTVGVARSADALALVAPTGTTTARYTFDDGSTQDVATTAGAYTVPTTLNRLRLRKVEYL